ncbi:hypothetical protein FRB95_004922 [Tulasnella sp. JGI-2019a]|nr:hypothetical protein FRB93_005855 [Tulasnella sp. JGI-2019a]KAG9029770.1 hypothetical protein FRB95_004922 [Tulasnella sp. JGI-2019a]
MVTTSASVALQITRSRHRAMVVGILEAIMSTLREIANGGSGEDGACSGNNGEDRGENGRKAHRNVYGC